MGGRRQWQRRVSVDTPAIGLPSSLPEDGKPEEELVEEGAVAEEGAGDEDGGSLTNACYYCS